MFSTRKKQKKTSHNTNCCVFNCNSRKNTNRSISKDEFGVDEFVERRKAWIKVLSITKPVSKQLVRVCSLHFKQHDCNRGKLASNLLRPKFLKTVFTHFELMGDASDLRPHQDELLQLADLAGIQMDKEIFRSMIQLLNLGVTPDAVFNLLKIIQKKKRSEQVKSRRTSNSQRTSLSQH